MPHRLFGMPRHKHHASSQCKRRKLERERSAVGDRGDSSASTIVSSVPQVDSVTPPGSVNPLREVLLRLSRVLEVFLLCWVLLLLFL